MAGSIGPAVKRQATVRPVLLRVMSPAAANTSRCFMIAGSETGKGRARSLTAMPSRARNCASNARRVGSAKAAKTRSSAASS